MAKKEVAPATIQEVVTLARRQIMLQKLIEDAEQSLKSLKDELRGVQEEDLPLAMQEAGGLKQFKLDTGEEIVIKEDVLVGITEEHKPEAFNWLESHGFGGIIKTVVAVEFGKGEIAKAQKLVLDLAAKKYNANLGRNVHYQTLKAFVSEQVRNASPIPMELFGVHPYNKAIVKLPK